MSDHDQRLGRPPITALLNPATLVRDLWQRRDLIGQFGRRDIQVRYRGSNLGVLWSLITPLALLAVFTLVFGVVFKAKWENARGTGGLAEFALALFAGQAVFQFFSESVSRAPTLITSVPNFVKKVVFPLEILAPSAVFAALFQFAVSATILLVASLVVYHGIPWTVVLLPAALLPVALLTLGTAWFLSSLGVYLRDIGHLIGPVLQALSFASPVFYPVSTVPQPYRMVIEANPLTSGITLVRDCLLNGQVSGWGTWLTAYLAGAVVAVLGYAWFRVTRKGFADVV